MGIHLRTSCSPLTQNSEIISVPVGVPASAYRSHILNMYPCSPGKLSGVSAERLGDYVSLQQSRRPRESIELAGEVVGQSRGTGRPLRQIAYPKGVVKRLHLPALVSKVQDPWQLPWGLRSGVCHTALHKTCACTNTQATHICVHT